MLCTSHARSPAPPPAWDPSTPSLTIFAPELSASLAKSWKSWHASDLPLDHDDDPRELDTRVRDLARCALEAVWDELEPMGTTTGAIIGCEVFPSLLDGYRPHRLAPIE